MPESTEPSAQARLNADISLLRGVLDRLFVPGEETQSQAIRAKAAFRLGAKREGGAPRPLEVVLGSMEQTKSVFQRAFCLKGEPVRLLRDLDADERQKLKQALAEIHERRASEEAPTFPVEPSCNTKQRDSSDVNWRNVSSAAIDRRSRECIASAIVRSVLNKRDELEAFVVEHFPVAIAVTETWLAPDVLESEVSLPGYASFRSDRAQPRMGGGVMLFIRESIPVTHLYSYADPDGQGEALWCKTKVCCNGYTTIGVCYRPPATAPVAILDDMRRWAGDGHCLILGDFNVPLIDWDENRCLPGADNSPGTSSKYRTS
ncbi:unnamed protein product [Echinostoma caproni]|uniref:Endo/exonuclease/phosphatase domain-containing protein n=1 Tax=Echinostoma caproni TaxID=27848 RepID=A0A183ATA5_9TREM|nr:unnamed protein product [Echinostoma caproni]